MGGGGADENAGVMLGAFGGAFAAAFGADLRAAFLRAGFAFFAVLRFAAGRPRRLAVARLPFLARRPSAASSPWLSRARPSCAHASILTLIPYGPLNPP